MKFKHAVGEALALAVTLTPMAWISLRMMDNWRGPMIECVWPSLAAACPVESRRWSGWVGRMEVLGRR